MFPLFWEHLFSPLPLFSLCSLHPWHLLLVLGLNPWSLLIMSMSHTTLTSYMIMTLRPLISSFGLRARIMLFILFRQLPLLMKKIAPMVESWCLSPPIIYLFLKQLFHTHDKCAWVWEHACCSSCSPCSSWLWCHFFWLF